MNTILSMLSDAYKIAVIQVGYQLLLSAKQRGLDDSDNPSIDIILEYCGFNDSTLGRMTGNIYWSKSIVVDPYHAFNIVSGFSSSEKAAVKEMLIALTKKDNHLLRMDIANQMFSILRL